FIGRVTGRCVDKYLPAGSNRFGVILNHSQLTMGNVLTKAIESFRRVIEGRFVVRTQFDRSAESAWLPVSPCAGVISTGVIPFRILCRSLMRRNALVFSEHKLGVFSQTAPPTLKLMS